IGVTGVQTCALPICPGEPFTLWPGPHFIGSAGRRVLDLQQRERDREDAALARDAGGRDAPIVAFDDLLHDIEAEANASAGTRLNVYAWDAIESLKDVRKLFGGNAHAVIDDGNQRLAVLALQAESDG